MRGRFRGRTPNGLAALLCVGASATLGPVATEGAARAADPPSCSSSTGTYSLALSALTGPQGADLTLKVIAGPGCAEAETLKKVQLKTFRADGALDEVRNLTDVAAPTGVADIELGRLQRGRLVQADVVVQPDPAGRAYIARGEATTRLRPDLVVATVHAPLQTLTTRPIDVQAEIGELNGDTEASATVSLDSGPTILATKTVTVPAGGRVPIAFTGVSLTAPTPVNLSVIISDVSPVETDATNDAGNATVDVTELELARSRSVVDGLGGYGAQFDQNLFAPITAAPPATLPDLEAKVKALEPQLVRIFYNVNQEADPSNLASFIKTVELAQDAGATINITYQTAAGARLQPVQFMSRFAAVLDDLVRTRGLTNVRWVTVQNEPNAPTNQITTDQYNALYRALAAELVARALRQQIGLMGGDLVESAGARDQRVWFQYMAHNMNDILDAYSVHIYWNYWDTARMQFRLEDVRQIVTEELPAEARKPVFVTEFGVRGIQSYPGKPAFQPGYWEDGTQMSRTNIEAFQMLWFDVLAAQLGFSGVAKWDAYWGKYDAGYNASWWLIGPAEEGWPLMPSYHALRLLLQVTERGWQVIGVDPWGDDDWKLDDADQPQDQPEKELAAYSGPNGELTLFGLDTHGGALNGASTEQTPTYSIGGLTPSTHFNLLLWNAAANGEDSIVGKVTANAAGVVRFDVPLHAAFALTTLPVATT
jgi:hypothetical protein